MQLPRWSPGLRLPTVLLAVAALMLPVAGHATTVRELGFHQLVQASDLVVEGTVVDLQTLSRGLQIERPKAAKEHRAPAVEAPDAGGEAAGRQASDAAEAPRSVGVEGGKMLFTQVTLEVDRRIAGESGETVTFVVAGGSDEEVTITVLGMPQFELGGRYLVFLHPDRQTTAVPIVGVHQGFFEVASDPATGRDMLLDADGDVVLGVEGDAVVVRHNPGGRHAHGPTPELGDAPRADDERGPADADLSPEVARYWLSDEAPMPIEDFIQAVRTEKETR